MDSQLPAIIFIEASTTGAGARANELARARGLYVVLLTRDRGRYGHDILSLADEIILCETNDASEVANVVVRCSQRFQVAAVTTTADLSGRRRDNDGRHVCPPGCAGRGSVKTPGTILRGRASRPE
jgi:hypothetical protein